MVRIKYRLYKQVFIILLIVSCLKILSNISRLEQEQGELRYPMRSPAVTKAGETYAAIWLETMKETAEEYPRLTSAVDHLGKGIDPRTTTLRLNTMRALSWSLYFHTCSSHDVIIDSFLSEKASKRITPISYIHQITYTRTVIDISIPDSFKRASQSKTAVTLLTQLTTDRTYMLDIIQKRWEGPIIAVIYGSDITSKQKQLSLWLNKLTRSDIKLLLVIKSGVLYPVNWLRNLSIIRALSEYIFVSDGDFVPSVGLYTIITEQLRRLESDSRNKTVIVVPAFEILISGTELPRSRNELLQQYKQGKADAFHVSSFPAAHNATNFQKWKKTDSEYLLPKEEPCNDHYEPYIVMKREDSPYFPEVLLERRKNKMAYQYALCINDYEYLVLRDGFLIHKYHDESMRASAAAVDGCGEMAWEVFKANIAKHPNDDHYNLHKKHYKEKYFGQTLVL